MWMLVDGCSVLWGVQSYCSSFSAQHDRALLSCSTKELSHCSLELCAWCDWRVLSPWGKALSVVVLA